MNPVSCSSPRWPAPGPQKERRPSFTISTNRTGSRRSVPWRCLPSEGEWPSLSSFAPAILQGWMSKRSCTTCSGIFGGRWPCCGIGERSIVAGKSNSGSETIQDCMWTLSQPTPRNSIRRGTSGARRIVRCPTVRPPTSSSFMAESEMRCNGSEDPQGSFGLASMLLISRGAQKVLAFLCLCEIQ